MIIGAHVSTSGGLTKALERGKLLGAEAIQIFPSAPVQWAIKGFSDDEIAMFLQEWPKTFKEVVFHGIYLTNLAATTQENCEKTKRALIATLKLASQLGIVKTIFHPGSYTNGEFGQKEQIKEILTEVFSQTPTETMLVYENTAGSTVGARLEELSWLLENSPSGRGAICLDTCHSFASGSDISDEEGYQAYINQVDRTIGLRHVVAWHLNDSKFELGKKRDRHENIGQGYLGQNIFRYLLNDPRWAETAGYLEVPGFDNNGPDKQNVDILVGLRK